MQFATRKRTAGTAWLEKTNPLHGMSIREAQAIFDAARGGDTQRLHWMFQEIESANPVLMTCVERRVSALSGFRPTVTARPSADPALAREQQDAVTHFINGIENLTDALEHLDLAFFRGFSYVQPLWDPDGTVRRIELPDSWLFLTRDGELYYNPSCDGFGRNAELVTPAARLVGVRRRRPIDYPALSIHIRQAVGDSDWGRFLERIALPKPAVIMAAGASDKDKEEYVEAAERVEDGLVSVWPNGAALTDFMGGSRGQDPFSAFIRHQEKKIVLLSTGGTLTSLAQADTGSLAGGAQMDVWREIVRKDASVVAQAVNGMVREYLAHAFPGREVAAEFSFDTGNKLTAQEAANVAATLKQAGWTVKQDELEKAVGFKLEKAPEVPPQGGLDAPFMTNKAGREGTPRTDKDETPLENAATAIENAPRKPDGQGDGPGLQALLGAFSRDLGPAADAVRELLKDIEDGKDVRDSAAALLEKLPDLLPDDPAMAAVIAEEMAKEFGTKVENKWDVAANREYKRETDGKFSEVDHPRDFKPGKNPDSAETQAAEIGKGKKAIEKCLAEKCDVPNAVSRGDVGLISLVYTTGGDDPRGLVHFLERPEARAHLAETLVRGEAIGPYNKGQKLNLKHGGYVATLRLTSDEKAGFPRNWILSGYGPNDKKEGAN